MGEMKSIAYGMGLERSYAGRKKRKTQDFVLPREIMSPAGHLRFKSVCVFEFRTREFRTDRTGKGPKSNCGGGGLLKTTSYIILIIHTNPARSRDYRLPVGRPSVRACLRSLTYLYSDGRDEKQNKNNAARRYYYGGRSSSSSIPRRGSLLVLSRR